MEAGTGEVTPERALEGEGEAMVLGSAAAVVEAVAAVVDEAIVLERT
mgnify:CR=1 FL=1